MKWLAGLSFALTLTAGVPVLANPPMKVVYSASTTTHFNWTWPYHPVEKYTAVQTRPYYYAGRMLYLTPEDFSKYRFYFSQRTCRNEWAITSLREPSFVPSVPWLFSAIPKPIRKSSIRNERVGARVFSHYEKIPGFLLPFSLGYSYNIVRFFAFPISKFRKFLPKSRSF